jgi:two-component system, OmpR family, response regulator
LRILIVEDEPKMARILRRGLEDEGYAVDTSAGGDDGLHMATENEYDAVLLDVMLPGRDGFEVCRELRARNRWAPVLMLTARDAVGDRVRGLDAGADDYLVKPFSFEELVARVRALVRRGAKERPVTLSVGPLTLDPATRRVERSGKPLSLTPKEYGLLEYLMRHAGEVLSRSRILEHVWDYNYDGGSNVVDVYVKYLRAKMDAPFGSSLLKTVRGAGYILEPEG